jgi:hypothetical protein
LEVFRRVLFAPRQLSFQACDLLFGVLDLPFAVGNLLLPFDYSTAEFFIFP